MSVTLSKPARTEWGVRHAASPDRKTHVDPRTDEADARRFEHALQFMGDRDAEVVTRFPGSDWHPAERSER